VISRKFAAAENLVNFDTVLTTTDVYGATYKSYY